LAQVDTLKTRLDAIPNILKRFRQSTLAAAVSGELIPSHAKFLTAPFSNLICEMKNGLSPKPNEVGAGDPILRISSVRPLAVDQDDHRFLECDEKTRSIYALQDGDLLFTRYNGSLDFVGVCGLYKSKKYDVLLYPDKLIRVRTDKKQLIAEYAEIFFSAPQIRRVVTDFIKSTSGQKGISGKDLKSVAVLYPAVGEQAEIVRRVEELFAFADQVEQRVKEAQARVNHLTQSILAKAFRGELTSEWRTNNPDLITGENSAAELLKRIQSERKKAGTKKKTRKR
jgi:type I restriction enzyme S subunit